LWKDLAGLTSCELLPNRIILSLAIHDPLLSFPPRMPPRESQVELEAYSLLQSRLSTPWTNNNNSNNVIKSSLWDANIRKSLAESIPRHAKEVQERRKSVRYHSFLLEEFYPSYIVNPSFNFNEHSPLFFFSYNLPKYLNICKYILIISTLLNSDISIDTFGTHINFTSYPHFYYSFST